MPAVGHQQEVVIVGEKAGRGGVGSGHLGLGSWEVVQEEGWQADGDGIPEVTGILTCLSLLCSGLTYHGASSWAVGHSAALQEIRDLMLGGRYCFPWWTQRRPDGDGR